MNYKVFPNESRLYDFLQLPSLIFYMEEYNNKEKSHNYDEIIITDYLDFVEDVEVKLSPFKQEIRKFYYKIPNSDYDFINLIFRINNIIGYKDEKSYLDMLLKLNEQEIISSIIYSIMALHRESIGFSQTLLDEAKDIYEDKNKLISFIKGLSVESSIKWDLFIIIDEALEYVKDYVKLMNKLLPIFNEIYLKYEEELNNYGLYLIDFLNKNGIDGLTEISYGILDPKLMDEGENRILISLVGAYVIRLMSLTKENYITWGIRIEDAFKQMKEINENKISERVQVFKNLGDKTRYEVVKLIATGETSTKIIAEALGVSSATISYHINNLVTSKIIRLDKTDDKYGYVVDYKLLDNIIAGLREDLNF